MKYWITFFVVFFTISITYSNCKENKIYLKEINQLLDNNKIELSFKKIDLYLSKQKTNKEELKQYNHEYYMKHRKQTGYNHEYYMNQTEYYHDYYMKHRKPKKVLSEEEKELKRLERLRKLNERAKKFYMNHRDEIARARKLKRDAQPKPEKPKKIKPEKPKKIKVEKPKPEKIKEEKHKSKKRKIINDDDIYDLLTIRFD